MALSSRIVLQALGSQAAVNALPALTQAVRVLGASQSRLLSTSSSAHAQPQEKPVEASTSQQEPKPQTPNTSETASPNADASSSSSQEGAAGAGAGANGAEQAEKVFGAFKSGFENMKQNIGSKLGDGAGRAEVLKSFTQEITEVFKPSAALRSATRKYTGAVMEVPEDYDGPSALAVVKRDPTAWEKMQEKISSIPFFARLRGVRVEETSAFKKGQEMVDDLKEKYETSDHPAVHKIEEVKEKVLSGSESSRAMSEIRTRDPTFDLNNFVRAIKLDAPVVVGAFLRHDLETLKLHCGPELLERLTAIFKHFSEAGMFEDPTILFVGDVEIVEVRTMDDDPFIIAQFHCQQLKCTRDQFGNVVDGSADAIQRVYYFWGLRQEKSGVVTAEGEVLPPRWVVKDMMWQSMLALV